MTRIQPVKRHGVCNSCGNLQAEDRKIHELRFSITGQGWTTVMLCPGCLRKLENSISRYLNAEERK